MICFGPRSCHHFLWLIQQMSSAKKLQMFQNSGSCVVQSFKKRLLCPHQSRSSQVSRGRRNTSIFRAISLRPPYWLSSSYDAANSIVIGPITPDGTRSRPTIGRSVCPFAGFVNRKHLRVGRRPACLVYGEIRISPCRPAKRLRWVCFMWVS